MLGEPLYILAHNLLLIRVRVRVEMAALALKVRTRMAWCVGIMHPLMARTGGRERGCFIRL